jgi:hypothetical protein
MKVVQGKATLAKAVPPKKMSVVKVIWPKDKLGPRGTSEIELVLAKPVECLKFFASQICRALLKDGATKATAR